jgi:hypothetical protein
MKTYWGVEVYLVLLTAEVARGDDSASSLGVFIRGESPQLSLTCWGPGLVRIFLEQRMSCSLPEMEP